MSIVRRFDSPNVVGGRGGMRRKRSRKRRNKVMVGVSGVRMGSLGAFIRVFYFGLPYIAHFR